MHYRPSKVKADLFYQYNNSKDSILNFQIWV